MLMPFCWAVHYDAEFETIEDALASEDEQPDTLAALAVLFSVSHFKRTASEDEQPDTVAALAVLFSVSHFKRTASEDE